MHYVLRVDALIKVSDSSSYPLSGQLTSVI